MGTAAFRTLASALNGRLLPAVRWLYPVVGDFVFDQWPANGKQLFEIHTAAVK